MDRRPAVRGGLLVAAAFFLAACGGGGGTAGTPTATPSPVPAASPTDLSTLDACSLVSVATASQLVGGQVAQVSISATSATSFCVYASGKASDGLAVFVQQTPGGDAKKVVQAALDRNAAPSAHLSTAVKGIGDTAGTKTDAHNAAVIFARHNLLVVLTATSAGKSGTDLLPKLEAIAKQVAAKL
jgi:hypothetical protein